MGMRTPILSPSSRRCASAEQLRRMNGLSTQEVVQLLELAPSRRLYRQTFRDSCRSAAPRLDGDLLSLLAARYPRHRVDAAEVWHFTPAPRWGQIAAQARNRSLAPPTLAGRAAASREPQAFVAAKPRPGARDGPSSAARSRRASNSPSSWRRRTSRPSLVNAGLSADRGL
jgi:hypothetical protein